MIKKMKNKTVNKKSILLLFSLSFLPQQSFSQEEINFIDEEEIVEEGNANLDNANGGNDAMEPATNIAAEDPQEAVENVENAEDLENLEVAGDEVKVEGESELGEFAEEMEISDAQKVTDEEMIADYGNLDGDIAKDVTEGVRIEDIIQPYSEYHFSSFGKPDPFVPPITIEELNKKGEDVVEVELKSVLQKHPLLALKVAGVWQVGTIRKALVTTPQNEGVVVQEGDPMGLRGGKVIGINDDFVTVREFDLVADGTRQFEDIKVFLTGKKPKEGGKIVFKAGAEPVIVEPEVAAKIEAPILAAPPAGDPDFAKLDAGLQNEPLDMEQKIQQGIVPEPGMEPVLNAIPEVK